MTEDALLRKLAFATINRAQAIHDGRLRVAFDFEREMVDAILRFFNEPMGKHFLGWPILNVPTNWPDGLPGYGPNFEPEGEGFALAELVADGVITQAQADDIAASWQEQDEPEPPEWDPGPEVDDEGGMSEYRHLAPEEPF